MLQNHSQCSWRNIYPGMFPLNWGLLSEALAGSWGELPSWSIWGLSCSWQLFIAVLAVLSLISCCGDMDTKQQLVSIIWLWYVHRDPTWLPAQDVPLMHNNLYGICSPQKLIIVLKNACEDSLNEKGRSYEETVKMDILWCRIVCIWHSSRYKLCTVAVRKVDYLPASFKHAFENFCNLHEIWIQVVLVYLKQIWPLPRHCLPVTSLRLSSKRQRFGSSNFHQIPAGVHIAISTPSFSFKIFETHRKQKITICCRGEDVIHFPTLQRHRILRIKQCFLPGTAISRWVKSDS